MFKFKDEQILMLDGILKKHQEEQKKVFDKTLGIVVDKLSPEGWTIPPQLTIYAINVIGQTQELDDINTFLKMYFSNDNYRNLQHLVDNILNSNIKSGLKKMITECWEAFQGKLYAICSTSLITVIEGVLSEFSENKQDIRMMKVCQKCFDELPNDVDKLEKYTWISYNKFIRNLYKKSDFDSDEPEVVNRHWLLHGRSDYEIDELDCIRLFNAIDSLCMIINKIAINQ